MRHDPELTLHLQRARFGRASGRRPIDLLGTAAVLAVAAAAFALVPGRYLLALVLA